MATLSKRKGHDVLLKALSKLLHLEWTLTLVGSSNIDPSWTQHLKMLVEQSKMQERVEFLGPVERVDEHYLAADIFALPSLYEGYDMVFAEAMAYGLPVIGCAAGAVPDLVPESAGILVPSNDEEALCQALNSLLSEPALREQLRSGAQAHAKLLPSWQDSARILSQTLSKEFI